MDEFCFIGKEGSEVILDFLGGKTVADCIASTGILLPFPCVLFRIYGSRDDGDVEAFEGGDVFLKIS